MSENWTKQDSLLTWLLEIAFMAITLAALACGIAYHVSTHSLTH
jgi:hypothetical protein